MTKRHWIPTVLLSSTLIVGCGAASETTPEATTPANTPASSLVPVTEDAPRPVSPATAPPVAAAPREIAAPAPAAPPRPRFRDVTAPAGTDLHLELTTALSSETAQVETPVTARLRRAVQIDGATVLPAGTTLHGNVTEVARAGRVKGRSHLAIRFTEATVDGQRERLRTNEITFEGEATKSEDATKIGAGAGIGAIIGGIVGGGDGAAKGAAIGGAAGTGAVLATRGRDVVLASGTDITASLASPFTTRVDVRSGE